MKILQILPRMNQGGVERGVVDMAKFYRERDARLIVVSGGGRLVKELAALGVKHYRLNVYAKSPLSLFSIPRLRRIIEKERVDIVHARSRVPAWISFFATRGSDSHFVTTAHGMYSVQFFSTVMALGKFVICPSQIIARHMQTHFAVSPEKISIVHRWVDLDTFTFSEYTPASKKISLLAVGRISPTKGYEYLIKAMRRIVRTNPYVNLNIVGAADDSKSRYLHSLKSLVHRYSLNYNIKFLGYQPKVEKLLAQSQALIVPSLVRESFGRVVVEAFACGVPVIASRIGAMAQIIEDGKDGLLVPPRDDAALADSILTLLGDSKLAKALTTNGRKKVEEMYSLSECIEKVHRVYEQTIRTTRILVIKISSLGDLVLIIPSLKALKSHWPHTHLTLLTLKKYASMFYDCPWVDSVIGLDDEYKRWANSIRIARQLRLASFDYIVDFQNSRASHLITFLSFARKSFGFSRKLGFLLTATARFPDKSVDPLSSQEKITRLLGVSLPDKKLHFWEAKPHDISRFGLEGNTYIGINVAASKKWETKNWPLAHLKKYIETVYGQLAGYKVILLGDAQARERARSLERLVKVKVINLCGKTSIRELFEVLKKCRVFVTPDTASLHVAQSLAIPTIALFGPTSYRAHTVTSEHLRVIQSKAECRACYRGECKKRDCMRQIRPCEVFSVTKELL